jgi:DNA polymerase-3 subunit delta
MKIYPDKLAATLATARCGIWLVAGDEPLQVAECADAVRAAARRAGCAEREVHFVERGFDWSEFRQALDSRSLFSDKRLVELRMPTGKPGDQGSKLLAEVAGRADQDLFLLIITGRLSAPVGQWVSAIEARGVYVTVYPPEGARLAQWLAGRCQRAGLNLDDDALQWLASRVEGNLLAAQQEIDKLALLHGSARITADAMQAAVTDSARFDISQLAEAALRGDTARALRTLSGLRAEGTESTLVLWSLAREIEALVNERAGNSKRGWRPPALTQAFETALRRLARIPLARLSFRAMRVDRMIKGRMPGDPWDELAQLAAEFCGVRMPLVRR